MRKFRILFEISLIAVVLSLLPVVVYFQTAAVFLTTDASLSSHTEEVDQEEINQEEINQTKEAKQTEHIDPISPTEQIKQVEEVGEIQEIQEIQEIEQAVIVDDKETGKISDLSLSSTLASTSALTLNLTGQAPVNNIMNDKICKLVAHAGGLIDDYKGTNSLEALRESVKRGYTLIEVDFLQTADGEYILNHDWISMSNRVPFTINSTVTLSEFVGYKIFNKFAPVTLKTLLNFLYNNPSVSIITDTKDPDYSVLEHIAEYYPDFRKRFIPQVYSFDDYSFIKDLGYNNIIVTLYAMSYELKMSPEWISEKARELDVYAITISDELMYDPEYVEKLGLDKTNYFVHTVDDPERARALIEMGVWGIYTDKLILTDSGNFEPILEYEQKYNSEISLINNNISELSAEGKKLLKDCLIYELNGEILINGGVAELIEINLETGPANCFMRGQKAFVPFYKTGNFLGATNFAYNYELDEHSFQFNGKDCHAAAHNETTIFSNTFFASEDHISNLFGCSTMKDNKFVVISKAAAINEKNMKDILSKISKGL